METSDPTNPPVSIVMSAFNAERTILRAYASLTAQTMDAWEHLIVNDGSSDGTGAIADAIAKGDQRVRVLHTPNRGTGAALNAGIAQARGEFVAFLDADDEYFPDHLQSHISFMHRQPSVAVLWGGVEAIVSQPQDAYVPDVVNGFGYVDISECVVQGTLFVRRHVFERFLFTEERLVWYQDFDFIQRAQPVFAAMRFPHITYRYYRNSGISLVDRVKQTWPQDPGKRKTYQTEQDCAPVQKRF